MLKADYFTIKNSKSQDKPNEDCFRCDDTNGIYIIMDGVTRDRENGKYPNPSPAKEVAEIVTDAVYAELLRQKKEGTLHMHKAVMYGNAAANCYNQNHREVTGDFAAGAVGIACVIAENVLHYSYIGDCIGNILSGEKITTFTTNQTAEVTKHKAEFTAREIRNIICNNKDHFCGYGVLNGLPGAEDFIRTGSLPLKEDTSILLSSDGCEGVFAMASLEELKTSPAKDLVVKYTTVPNAGDRTLLIINPIAFPSTQVL